MHQSHNLNVLNSNFRDSNVKLWASVLAQVVKNLPAMPETPVQYLDPEDPLEKSMATHSSILSWSNPWTEEPDGL